MGEVDISVCKRFSEELARLKKAKGLTQSFVAEKCDVTTKTVGRWCKSIAIPSDKLQLLAPYSFDVLYIIYGIRFPVLKQFRDKLVPGESLDDLIDTFYQSVRIFRSELDNSKKLDQADRNNEVSEAYANSDHKIETQISDPSSSVELGSNHSTKTTQFESDLDKVFDSSVGSGSTLTSLTTPIDAAELGSLGKIWWEAVTELSETQRNAVLTLVFNHVIAKFIELNMERDENSKTAPRGSDRLSQYLNSNRHFTVVKNSKTS